VLPWARQAVSDLKTFYANSPELQSCLPDSSVDQTAWSQFMAKNADTWNALVSKIHFYKSSSDRCVYVNDMQTLHVELFPCPECKIAAFPSMKALKSHMRTKHRLRCPMRLYANSDTKCQSCETVYSSRLRLLAHLTDSRGPGCRDWCLQHGTKITIERMRSLDEFDAQARRKTHKAGLTQPRSRGPAITADGKFFGRHQVG